MEDVLGISSRHGFNTRSWVLMKLGRCEGVEVGTSLGFWLHSHTWDSIRRNCYLRCHGHCCLTSSRQADDQTVENTRNTHICWAGLSAALIPQDGPPSLVPSPHHTGVSHWQRLSDVQNPIYKGVWEMWLLVFWFQSSGGDGRRWEWTSRAKNTQPRGTPITSNVWFPKPGSPGPPGQL